LGRILLIQGIKHFLKTITMLKVTIQHKQFSWQYDVPSFEYGIILANNLQEKFGLIGRTYILSSCGKQTWIR